MYDFHSYLISFLKHLLIGIYLYTFLQVHSKFPDSIRENRVCCSCHYSCCCSDCSYFQWTWQEHQLRDHCLITADTDTCLFLKNGKCVKNVNVSKKIRNYNTSLFVLWLLRKVILLILTLKFEEKFFQDIHIYFITNKKFFQKKP